MFEEAGIHKHASARMARVCENHMHDEPKNLFCSKASKQNERTEEDKEEEEKKKRKEKTKQTQEQNL
jgi:hypothetical protein